MRAPVYRISGVLAVISGWFLTAMCAFSACALVTWALFEGGSVVAVLFMLVAVVSLVRSNFFGKKKEESSFDIVADNTDKDSIRANIGASVDESIDTAVRLMREGLTAFQAEDEKVLNRCKNEAVNLFEDISRSRGSYYRMALRGGGDDLDNEARHIYYRIFNGMKELSHELRSVLGMSANHIANRHRPYSGALGDNLDQMLGILEDAALPLPGLCRGRRLPRRALGLCRPLLFPHQQDPDRAFAAHRYRRPCPCAAVTCI